MSGREPDERVRVAVNLQRWERLTFVHWRYPPEVLRPLVPPRLELQVLDGSAWVGMTPFVLSRLRVPGLPAVPGWSSFAEVNLRTYVTDGEHDGIWFLRVHCARRLVTAALRWGLGLPYVYTPGTVGSQGGTTTYELGGTRAAVQHGGPAERSPVLDSLTGRFNAFTRHAGQVWRVPVEHPPWPLHDAELLHLDSDMPSLAGLPEPREDPVAHFSPGVDVRLGAPRLVRS
jgi:uncharacterized protein YqjF (DUF2071 family)